MERLLGARLHSGETLGDRVLKVDHAGEHGAVNIYRWQKAVAQWRSPSLVVELDIFLQHEMAHRALFAKELQNRSKRRCRVYHLCGAGGVMLGIVTGLIGPRAVHATTVAIERVVLRHLHQQIKALRDGKDDAAINVLQEIIADEESHHDVALKRLGNGGILSSTISLVVETSTEAVIWMGMKL